MRKLLVLVLVVVGVAYIAGAFLFLRYDDDPLRKADAIVVLAGGESRLPVGLRLARDGAAPLLVLSEDVTRKDGARVAVCDRGTVEGAELVCRAASPYSTRGEARFVADLAEKRGWKRLVVVSSRYHLFRAKRLFERCTDAELIMRGAEESDQRNAIAIPLEWIKLARAETLARGC
jgi:uncharacterized SAM-binding protein YcdF (DUF218 family)